MSAADGHPLPWSAGRRLTDILDVHIVLRDVADRTDQKGS